VTTYQQEPFEDLIPEIEALVPAHWEEFASHQEAFGRDVDWGMYRALACAGTLVVVTARQASLVGYIGWAIGGHPHRKTVMTGQTRFMYAVDHPMRGLWIRGMIRESVRVLEARGVRLLRGGSKLSANAGPIWENLGFTAEEIIYSKVAQESQS
jgi:hypothetical protein